MTGKELIIYILENNLENQEIIFINLEDAAKILNTNIATIQMLFDRHILSGFKNENSYYILLKDILMLKEDKNE